MRRCLLHLILLLPLLCYLAPSQVMAATPFAPFSTQGNPPEAYYFESIFPLFRYIQPDLLKVFENKDRSRSYEPLEICGGANSDRRVHTCDNDINNSGEECIGGEVDLCFRATGDFSHTVTSGSGSCTANKSDPQVTTGKCEYKTHPTLSSTIKGTDFSATQPLAFNKYQNEAKRFSNIGTPKNPITYGSHFLALNQCDRVIKQFLVVERALQTKQTVQSTGEWPLGWVDWGYQTPNGKTLLEINQELPGDLHTNGHAIIEATDDFFLNAGLISDYSGPKKAVCDSVAAALNTTPPAPWAQDLSQSPMYPPSFRQGYTRGSICVWELCCPGPRCPLATPEGPSRALYYDISISQAFGASLDDLLLNYPLEDGIRLFKKLAAANPLIRFAGAAGPQAIPSAIAERLDREGVSPCLEYIPSFTDFTFKWFGSHMDYVKPGSFLDPQKKCPDYGLQGELTKEQGGALPESLLSRLINMVWGNPVDQVEPVVYHLITIPDAMGQSITEIQQPVFQIRDKTSDLKSENIYNKTLSNIVDATSEFFYAGKGLAVGDAKRRLAYFSCRDPMYSSPEETSIQQYALGTRIGCFSEPAPEGVCDGKLFAELLKKNNGVPTEASAKADAAFTGLKELISPELLNIYGAASAVTGVPCEILAGIHFVEANFNPQGSLVSGRTLGTPEPDAGGAVFKTLLDTAVYAGNHLKGKVGGELRDVPTTITALSRYNGGGNSNCQLGYPYNIPYDNCPRKFEGEDDPYPLNWLDDRHATMYLLYCADHTACVPQVFQRPGSFTVALEVYNQITKDSVK